MAMVQIRARDSSGRFVGQESKVEICPKCGASCNDDVTISDHGMCYDCHKEWQFGLEPEVEDE